MVAVITQHNGVGRTLPDSTIWLPRNVPRLGCVASAVPVVAARKVEATSIRVIVVAASLGIPVEPYRIASHGAKHLDQPRPMTWVEVVGGVCVDDVRDTLSRRGAPALSRRASSGHSTRKTCSDPEKVLEFWSRHRTVIYKSISSVRNVVARLTPTGQDRIPFVRWCPTQFRPYIAGTDYRVHVVGSEILACKITSNADDYRMLRCKGPDLRQMRGGQWYCFEVNSSPGCLCLPARHASPLATRSHAC
jgi:hypothetical protein